MSWSNTMTLMVRSIIGDLSVTPRYSDERIAQSIVVAGLIVTQEIVFPTTYTFDFSTPNISPDPTINGSIDNAAIALFVLKAACLLFQNDYQLALANGIEVQDGDSRVKTTGSFGGYADLLKNGPCASYQRLLNKISTFGIGGLGIGGAVLSPYSSGGCGCGPSGPNGIWNARGFFDSFLGGIW